jgi:hypothetical protein
MSHGREGSSGAQDMPLHPHLDFSPPVHDAFSEDIDPKPLLDSHRQFRQIE